MNGPNATGLHQPYTDGGSRYAPGDFMKRAYGNWGYETGAAGPGNAPFRQNSSLESPGNTVPDWSDFLGPPMRPLDNNPAYHVENYDLPDAYRGSSFYKSKVMISLITSDELYFCNELLPWEVREDCMEVAWDVWEFDDALMNRQPEESVNRLVTSSKRAFSAPLIRHGLNLLMEDGFRSTAQGQLAFFKGEQQLKNAFVETMALSAATAILNIKAPDDTYHQRQGADFQVTTEEYEQLVREHVERFGICHKKPDGFAAMFEWCKTVLRERGHFNSDYTIVPYGMKKMLGFAQSRFTGSPTGPSYDVNGLAGGNYGTIRESRSFRAGDDRANYDPFFRDVTIGGFFVSNDEHTAIVKPAEYTTAMRDLFIYTEKNDNFIRVKLRALFEHAGLFDDDTKTRAFTDIGRKYFDYYPNWHALFEEAKMLETLIKKLQSDTTGQTFIDMLHILGQNQPAPTNDPPPAPIPTGTKRDAGSVRERIDKCIAGGFDASLATNRMNQLADHLENSFIKNEVAFERFAILLAVIYATEKNDTYKNTANVGVTLNTADMLMKGLFDELEIVKMDAKSNADPSQIVYLPNKDSIQAYRVKYDDTKATSAAPLAKAIYKQLVGPNTSDFAALMAKFPAFATANHGSVMGKDTNGKDVLITLPIASLAVAGGLLIQEELGLDAVYAIRDQIGITNRLLACLMVKSFGNEPKDSPTQSDMGEFATAFRKAEKSLATFSEFNFQNSVFGRVRLTHNGRHVDVAAHLATRLRRDLPAFIDYHQKKWGPMLKNMNLPDDLLTAHNALITDAVAAFGAFQGTETHEGFARKAAAFMAYVMYLYRLEKADERVLPGAGISPKQALEFVERIVSRKDNKKEAHDLFALPASKAVSPNQGPASFRAFREMIDTHAEQINSALETAFALSQSEEEKNAKEVADSAGTYAVQVAQSANTNATDAFLVEAGGFKVKGQFVIKALQKASITSGKLFDWLLDNNMPFPLGFIGFRPHQRYTMGSAVHCVAGHDLGSTVVGHVNILHGRDTVRKMTLVNMTGYGKPIVFYPSKAVIYENCMSVAYLGGNGHAFFPYDPEVREAYQRGGLHFDIFVVAVPVNYRPDGIMLDITGAYDSGLVKDQQPHAQQYPSAHIYSSYWRWSHGPGNTSEPDQNEYFAANTRHARYNTVCLQSFTANFSYNGAGGGSFSAITTDEGHWGSDVYPGCGKVRKGLWSFFDKADFEVVRQWTL